MPRAVLRRPEVSGSATGSARLAPRNGAWVPMSATLRGLILGVGALLWLSGVLWLVLHFAFAQRTQFGPLPNPWEPTLMRVHGVLAVCGVFLLGCMTAGHVLERWGSARNRLTGLTLAATALVLSASGYALYYTTGSPHDLAALTHEALGVLVALVALTHWWRRRAAR